MIIALSFDDALAGRLLASAAQENEPFWRLPLAEFPVCRWRSSTAINCRLTLPN